MHSCASGLKMMSPRAVFYTALIRSIFFLCFFSPVFSHAEDLLQINAQMQFHLAEHFFADGEYADAIREYKRFLFFFPNHSKAGEAQYRIGEAYFEKGEYPKAAAVFDRIIETAYTEDASSLPHTQRDLSGLQLSRQITQAYFMRSKTFMKMNNPPEAYHTLRNLILLSRNKEIWDEAFYRMGWIYTETAMWEKALLHFNKISEENREKYRVKKLSEELARSDAIPQKNPKLAGALALLPGAGFLYCERYRDALTAFLFNGALMLAAYKAFDDDNPALGGVISLVGSGFYLGNIYGSVSSAHKYNRDRNFDFMENIRENTRMDFSYMPGAAAFMISVRHFW